MLKSPVYQKRFYRNWGKTAGLARCHFCFQETDLCILTDKPVDKKFLAAQVRAYRWQIQAYGDRDPRFLSSLKPVPVEHSATALIKEMASASRKAGVGPMASVAGALAHMLGMDLLRRGFKEVIIENGGDIFMASTKERTVAIYAGDNRRWKKLGLKVKPRDTPLGICASSGTIGHSLSFGSADSVVIISPSASLADAAATATANRVKSSGNIEEAVRFARSIRGVTGVVIIAGDALASWGRIEFTV